MSARISSEKLRVLLCDPENGLRRQLRIAVRQRGVLQVMEAESIQAACALASQADVAFVALDPGQEDLLARLCEAGLGGALLAALNQGSVTSAVAAMRAGAQDVVLKPFRVEDVAFRLLEMAEERPVPRNGRKSSADLRGAPMAGADFCGFMGRSPAMQKVYEHIHRIASSRAPVFVTGESGTGKELAAAAVHARSQRHAAAFHALNCSAIPRDLMESEIFGHARGAFTGAHADRAGAAELADGGTLFLDEIGEMDMGLQAKLLRFLQDGKVRRIGEGFERQVDVRIVCATNRDPVAEVKAGRLREDLFYRLHVLHLHLPPLRARDDDVVQLAEAFLARFSREEGRPLPRLGPEGWAALRQRHWRGNVRELQNLMRRAVVLSEGAVVPPGLLVEEALAPDRARGVDQAHAGGSPAGAGAVYLPASPAGIEPLAVTEQRIIEHAIALCGGNVVQAASALDLAPSTLYRKRQGWRHRSGKD